MSSRPPGSCPHELRPGTTVCLHCRRLARESTSARARRTATRVAAVGAVLVGGVAVASRGTNALPRHRAGNDEARTTPPAAVAQTPPVAAVTAAAVAAAERAPAPAPIAAAPGVRSPLRMRDAYVVRRGDSVTVWFDGVMTRTRRADKFERIVRATLPEVYGAVADSLLAHVRPGTLVGGANLVTELPVRGLRLPSAAGGAGLTLWPETRPGRDGPLVVAYRVTVTR